MADDKKKTAKKKPATATKKAVKKKTTATKKKKPTTTVAPPVDPAEDQVETTGLYTNDDDMPLTPPYYGQGDYGYNWGFIIPIGIIIFVLAMIMGAYIHSKWLSPTTTKPATTETTSKLPATTDSNTATPPPVTTGPAIADTATKPPATTGPAAADTVALHACEINLAGCNTSLETYREEAKKLQTLEELQAENARLTKELQLVETRNTVYTAILEKWRLPIPEGCELEQFDIVKYFCTTWCPWYKNDLPEVKKDYEDSDCPACERPKAKAKPKAKTHRPRNKTKTPPARTTPPPTTYTPPPKPKVKVTPGPTAPCPD